MPELANTYLENDASLRTYYKMDNVNDSTANANNLTNVNSVVFSPSKFNSGADYGTTNTDKVLALSANPLSDVAMTNLSVSFWVKLRTEIPSGNYRLFELNSNLTGTGVACFVDYSSAFVLSGNVKLSTTNSRVTRTASALGTAAYYHVVLVKANTQVELYVNGVSIGTNTGTGTDASNSSGTYHLSIGSDRLGTDNSPVFIDDFAIFEKALTITEVKFLYAGTNPGNIGRTIQVGSGMSRNEWSS